ncbi:MAG TPA: FeoB-associated Cys-rich membrane protein [Flavobacteriaceae bacterium]|nr:FeoB-associated Cys-rich membrane protein [Flavobacteriaceae bacterium]HBS13003.1 FeoB-associated Cys-rich membrane protein [Flavobacteriaceae bacterium]
MVQIILVYVALALALLFLIKKFFIKNKKKSSCSKDCDC